MERNISQLQSWKKYMLATLLGRKLENSGTRETSSTAAAVPFCCPKVKFYLFLKNSRMNCFHTASETLKNTFEDSYFSSEKHYIDFQQLSCWKPEQHSTRIGAGWPVSSFFQYYTQEHSKQPSMNHRLQLIKLLAGQTAPAFYNILQPWFFLLPAYGFPPKHSG